MMNVMIRLDFEIDIPTFFYGFIACCCYMLKFMKACTRFRGLFNY